VAEPHAVEPKPAKPPSASQATRIVRMAASMEIELFCDGENRAYASIPEGHTFALETKAFSQWLARAYYNATKNAPSEGTLKDAIRALAASAFHRGVRHDVYVRTAALGQEVWLDLGQQAVHVTAEGWTLRDRAPVKFLRPRGVLPLPTPTTAPAADLPILLSRVLNVGTEDMPMIIAWLLAVLRGRAPFPILILTGDHGTAKSYGSQTLRSISDPNIAPLRSTPKEDRDLMIAARNSHVLAFDNLSTIPEAFSDQLCRLATGAGFATRELHTDTDEIIFQAAKPIILNSIADVARRPDLLDRAIVVGLDPISPKARLTVAELDARFRAEHPALLGALLDAVVGGLRNEPTTKLPILPRMADFATWVEACAPAMGWPAGLFLELFDSRQRVAVSNLLSDDLVADALQELVLPWIGTPTDLFNRLARPERQRTRDWPQTVAQLTARLKRLAAPLRDHGLVIEFKRTGKSRVVQITRNDAQAGLVEESDF